MRTPTPFDYATPPVVNVSPSVLADILTCETKGYVRHELGYTSRHDNMKAKAGQAIHEAMRAYFRPGMHAVLGLEHGTPEVALAAFHAHYDEFFRTVPAENLDAAYTPTNIGRILTRWFNVNPHPVAKWKRVLHVEEAIHSRTWRTPGGTEVRLICRPDLIVERHDGYIAWDDTKSTGWRIGDPGWRSGLRLSLQAALYTDAIVQKYGDRAWGGGWFNAIEVRELPGNPDAPPKLKMDGTPAKPMTCKDHKTPYAECGDKHAKFDFIEAPVTPELVEAMLIDAEEAANTRVQMIYGVEGDMRRLNMHGRANEKCRFCANSGWCEDTARNVEALEAYLVHEPWAVEEGCKP